MDYIENKIYTHGSSKTNKKEAAKKVFYCQHFLFMEKSIHVETNTQMFD